MSAYRFTVTGRVQGVGYRTFVALCARTHGVKGEVWNSRDGSVIGICEAEDCSAFLAALKLGPGHVQEVSFVEVTPTNPIGFEITKTR